MRKVCVRCTKRNLRIGCCGEYLDLEIMKFENRVLWRVFGPRDDVTCGWYKLHNKELHNLYSSSEESRRMR
jgi:hypothetical protein